MFCTENVNAVDYSQTFGCTFVQMHYILIRYLCYVACSIIYLAMLLSCLYYDLDFLISQD